MRIKSFKLYESKGKLPIKTVEFNGFQIIYGKSAEANEEVTFNLSDPNDIWLHTSGVPGSHVIIKVKDVEPTDDIIKYAAILAVNNSKSQSNIQPVIWTRAKYVSKERGMNTGQVKVENGTLLEINKSKIGN